MPAAFADGARAPHGRASAALAPTACRSKRLRVTSLMLLMLSSRGMSTIGFRTAQEVMFVRAARDNAMTAGLQKSNPGACDLVPVGDYQRGHFAPRRSRPSRRTIDLRGHDVLHGNPAGSLAERAIPYRSRRHADAVELPAHRDSL